MRARFEHRRSVIRAGALIIILAITFSHATAAWGAPATAAPPAAPSLTWETLEERMQAEEAAGFSGSVLVVRGDRVVLDRGYGFANREEKIPATPETVYGIGSTPIDFTRAAILLLVHEGKVKFDDPVTKWFDNVPQDKRAITVEHLMEGQSGLQDFHDVPGDRDPDHSWIDRKEAIRRIWDQKLLFEPGTGDQHSHSAWGVLAAIVEIASGKTYPEFTRKRIFEPAGMTDTGFFGEPIAKEKLAIGYGPKKDGEINAPPYWGPTSWLVMGSGGQTSTTRDLRRYAVAMREGRIVPTALLDRYYRGPQAVFVGGDMYGYEITYTDGRGDSVILIGNVGAGEHFPRYQSLARELVALVQGRPPARFSLGVRMDVRSEGRVAIIEVVGGSAAADAGLQAGDVLLTAGGQSLSPEPMRVLAPYLNTGEAIELEYERGGERRRAVVKPKPRD